MKIGSNHFPPPSMGEGEGGGDKFIFWTIGYGKSTVYPGKKIVG